ncbi:hypothetical protein [Candidatus Arsenophonus triatominarum]|uniref:hypothetical protein n=1 Tax=Candidatus Arsenophonus triatominarum TaxID=57911 RepID=UPI0007C5ABCF
MLELKQPFKNLWQGKDPFIEIEKLDGKIFRQLETRKTLCLMKKVTRVSHRHIKFQKWLKSNG